MIELDIVSDEGQGLEPPLPTRELARYAGEVLAGHGCAEGSVNIVFVGDERMTGLNETYKGRTGSTDVLSFDLSDEGSDILEGEIYISLPRAREQAEEYGAVYTEEVARLVTHGLLHLAGWTHDTEESMAAMTTETERLVADLMKGDIGR